MGDDYLTLAEAAKYLKVNRVKFARMVKRLKIPFVESAFDARVKLFKKTDLDIIKNSPRVGQDEGEEEGEGDRAA